MTMDKKILDWLRSSDNRLGVMFLYIALELNRNVIQVQDVIKTLLSSPIWGNAAQQRSRFLTQAAQNPPRSLAQLLANLNHENWVGCETEGKLIITYVEDRIRINEAKAVIGTILYAPDRDPDCSDAHLLKNVAETVRWVCLEICHRAIYFARARDKGTPNSREPGLLRGINEHLSPLMQGMNELFSPAEMLILTVAKTTKTESATSSET